MHFGNASSIFAFFHVPLAVWEGLGSPLFIPCVVLLLGGLKGQESHGWFLTTHVFGHFLCLWHEQESVGA